jgi:hypothetical protein
MRRLAAYGLAEVIKARSHPTIEKRNMTPPFRLALIGCIVVATAVVGSPANADIVNGGFETNDLSGWQTRGISSVQTAAFGLRPAAGDYNAFLSTSDGSSGASQAAIEDVLGLSPGELDGLGNDGAVEGSLLYQSFTASAGDVVSFNFAFITDEKPDLGYPFDDFAFVSIAVDGVLQVLASVVSKPEDLSSSPVPHGSQGAWGQAGEDWGGDGLWSTSFLPFSHTLSSSGNITLGIGVMDGEEDIPIDYGLVESGLLVDNVAVTSGAVIPEPSSLVTFTGLLGMGLIGYWRRRKR